jgi:hypothetical protein
MICVVAITYASKVDAGRMALVILDVRRVRTVGGRHGEVLLFCYIKEAQKSGVCCRTKSCVQCSFSIVFQVSREFQYTVSSSESR